MTKYSHEENVSTTATTFKMQIQQIIEKITEEQFQEICRGELIYEEKSDEKEGEIHIEYLEQATPKIEDNRLQVHNPMEEVNLTTVEEPRITSINSLLPTNLKEQVISLLQEFKDYFNWN